MCVSVSICACVCVAVGVYDIMHVCDTVYVCDSERVCVTLNVCQRHCVCVCVCVCMCMCVCVGVLEIVLVFDTDCMCACVCVVCRCSFTYSVQIVWQSTRCLQAAITEIMTCPPRCLSRCQTFHTFDVSLPHFIAPCPPSTIAHLHDNSSALFFPSGR